MSGDLIPAEAIQGDNPPPLTEADLDAHFDGDFGDVSPADHWQITGTGTATWAMAKLAEARRQLAAIADQAGEFHDRIDEWAAHEARRPGRNAEYFAGHLERYALWLRESSGVKTLNLPNGKVGTREQSHRAVVTDADALMAWADANDPAMIETTRKVPAARLRERVTLLHVPTRIVVSCGCITELVRGDPDHDGAEHVVVPEPAWATAYGVGSGINCEQCGQEALVGQWLDYAVLPVAAGEVVPGVAVEPVTITATAKPEGVALEGPRK